LQSCNKAQYAYLINNTADSSFIALLTSKD
jgi:hypothetical protein